jgi:FAD/FMN-containing dehydrogenase
MDKIDCALVVARRHGVGRLNYLHPTTGDAEHINSFYRVLAYTPRLPPNMDPSLILTSVVALLIAGFVVLQRLRTGSSQARRDAEAEKPHSLDLSESLSEHALRLQTLLAKELTGRVVTPEDIDMFKRLVTSHWARQECEATPACIVQPHDAQEVSRAVKRLKTEFDRRQMSSGDPENKRDPLFAIRSGGHSPVAGAASIKGGVLIDMSHLDEIVPSQDGTSVRIGAGCKWKHVSEVLEQEGLAVVGARNSAVGVGGSTLGGGLSFFSPRFGFVCSNVIEYEIVLADGTITTVSETVHCDLWRALKGGANNFGIVTCFTFRSFPSGNVWSGFLYMPSSQAQKVLAGFNEFLDRIISNEEGKAYDKHAAGPLACFTYLQQLGIQAVAVNLVHTQPPSDTRKWPVSWQGSRFSSLWRFWSTCKVRSLTSATDEMNALNPPGRRQTWATTTIKNDPATLEAAHRAYREGITAIRAANIEGMSWTLVLQPLLPDWARIGDPNPLGLDTCADEPLVVINFTVNWAVSKDDAKSEEITRAAIESIDLFAGQHGTGNEYRYTNYCGAWQKPFESYGKKNHNFLKETSRKYDPDGLFQWGCTGGFKLGR